VRERIETSGRDARWEFNKATLFSCSNYMAEVCGNLMEMVEVVDDFFKFLGPELKAVTGERASSGLNHTVLHVAMCPMPVLCYLHLLVCARGCRTLLGQLLSDWHCHIACAEACLT
jgi:hypothetical protein